MSDKTQGIVRVGRGEQQPADKERAQKAVQTEQRQKPDQPSKEKKPS